MEKNDPKYLPLKKIRDEVFELTSSPLYTYRKESNYFPVIGEGSHDAHIMFIGEGPGKNEAQQGRPFCGAAGKILDELLASINLPRNEVYITNIIKDRPPQNRDPLPEEIEIYALFLDRQIDIIQPRIIATLGRFSMAYIMERFGLGEEIKPISVIHGKKFPSPPSFKFPEIIIPLYHPAVAIYDRKQKETLLRDFQILKNSEA